MKSETLTVKLVQQVLFPPGLTTFYGICCGGTPAAYIYETYGDWSGWLWMKMNESAFLLQIFSSIYVYFPQIFQADSANCFATLWGVDDKEDGKESKFGQILLEVGWNFCPLYGGAIVPLGCVPKVFSSDDNSLSWLWMGRLYGWDPEDLPPKNSSPTLDPSLWN